MNHPALNGEVSATSKSQDFECIQKCERRAFLMGCQNVQENIKTDSRTKLRGSKAIPPQSKERGILA